jgi:ElaB/YqjD/DUF883 family membrane-anchored ribosome-binding protein
MSDEFTADGNSQNFPEPGNPTTDRIAGMAHDGIDQVARTANHAEHSIRDVAAKTSEAAKHTQEQAAATANESLRKLRLYVEENPLTTAGIAFAAGVLLSSLVRR